MLDKIKNIFKKKEPINTHRHFYGVDLWGKVSEKLEPFLTEGLTFYGEVVGYVAPEIYIQKQYDYGCNPGEFDIYIYRITQTNASGVVFELSWSQVKDFCEKVELKTVPEYYFGYARDLFDIPVESHWQENFLAELTEKYLEKDCDMCVLNSVPAEGIVIRKETSDFEAFKHKSFRFKEHESKMLDSGEVDLETQESYATEEV